MARMKELYRVKVVPSLTKRFGYKNPMEVPRLKKIVVNMGVGEAIANPKLLDAAVEDIAIITGQRPAITRAKRSVSNFRLRAGMAIYGQCLPCRANGKRNLSMSEAATLVERLDAAISSNPHLFRHDLRCSSKAGHVTISGNVNTFFQKQMAQEAIRYVDGVERIENQLEVTWG